jgi:hypothetical protein
MLRCGNEGKRSGRIQNRVASASTISDGRKGPADNTD